MKTMDMIKVYLRAEMANLCTLMPHDAIKQLKGNMLPGAIEVNFAAPADYPSTVNLNALLAEISFKVIAPDLEFLRAILPAIAISDKNVWRVGVRRLARKPSVWRRWQPIGKRAR